MYFILGKATSAGDMLSIIPEETKTPLASDGEKGCESCFTITSTRWVPWGPAHEHCRLCAHCYIYWRKYGGLKLPTKWGENLYVTVIFSSMMSYELVTIFRSC